jgi:hypothetical protein
MRTIFGKKETITDKMSSAVLEAKLDNKCVKEFHLEESEYSEFLKLVSGLEYDESKKCYYQGIEVKKVPKYDLFHNGDYWVIHNFGPADGYGVVEGLYGGPFLVHRGRYYRKVSNLAGEPAPVKNKSDETIFRTESDGISFNHKSGENPNTPYPDLALIHRLQKKFVMHTAKSLTLDETIDLVNHQRQHILNLEIEKKKRFTMGTM